MASVSVVIPVFNGERYLRFALESALAQTCRNCEVIVVDDGSNDGTAALIESFAGRILAIAQENRGPAAARNRGAAVARGRYVAFLDADDTWEPTFLERSLRAVGDEASFSGWSYIDAGGHPLPRGGVRPGVGVGLAELALRNRFPPSAMVVAAELFRSIGGFDTAPGLVEDWDFCLRAAAVGATFHAVPEVLCRYRIHEHNISHDVDRMRAGFLATLAAFYARPELPPAVAACRAQATSYVLMETSARLVFAGREEEGRRDFLTAVAQWPKVLEEEETYYSALCAGQPMALKASGKQLPLAEGHARVDGFLRACVSRDLLPPEGAAAAFARLHRVSALLAYTQGDCRRTRRDVWRAVLAAPGAAVDRRLVAAFLKSFAGGAALRRLRRGAQGSV